MKKGKLSRMGRRRFTKIATAMGVSWASLVYGTQEGLVKAMRKNEVPYVRYLRGEPEPTGNGREPIYDSIPRDEWGDRWTAVDLRGKVANRIYEKWGDPQIIPGFSTLENSPIGFGVKVYYTTTINNDGSKRTPEPSFDEVRSELPSVGKGTAGDGNYRETRENIPIIVERRTVRPSSHCIDTLFKDPYDSVPGGLRVDMSSWGSMTAPFYSSKHGGEGWISSGHVPDSTGEDVLQGGNSDATGWEKIGEVSYIKVTTNSDIDFSIVKDTVSGKVPYERMADDDGDDGYEFYIDGIVTDDTLVNDAGTSETYYTQAYKTGRKSCTIIGTGGVSTDPSWVSCTSDVDSGDSGGALYTHGPRDGVFIAGVIAQKINDDDDSDDYCGNDAKCTTAETVENHGDGYFTTW